jgi:arylsulfatase
MISLLALLSCVEPETEPGARVDFTPTEATNPDADRLLVFPDGPPKNILMISIDTLRKNQLGFYGGPADTPFLDSLLAGSVHLDNHMQCSSWTYVSTSCTLMGGSHEANGYMPLLTQLQEPLPDTTHFVAESLTDAGFLTAIHSPNEWLSATWNNTKGYQIQMNLGGDAASAASQASVALLNAVEDQDAEKWMLHLHFLEPHSPYNPPEEYLTALADLPAIPFDLSDRDVQYAINRESFDAFPESMQEAIEAHLRVRYLGELAWLDDKLERIFNDFEARGMLEDSLVVLWSDHGETFWEHGHQTHAWDLYPEENDAILAFLAPGLAPKAFAGPTHAYDLAPTLLDLYGIEIPPSMDGVVLGTALEDRFRYASTSARAGPVQMIRQGDDALYYNWRQGKVELFDLAQDPTAMVDLRASEPVRTQQLWEALTPWIAALDPLLETDAPLLPSGLD